MPERPEPLEGASTAGGKLFATLPEGRHDAVRVHDLDGKFVREVDAARASAPPAGSAASATTRRSFYTFSSLTAPPTIYRYDIATGAEHAVPRRRRCSSTPTQYETKQVFYPSKDGTRVPMFIAHKKGIEARRHEPDAALRLRRVQHRR